MPNFSDYVKAGWAICALERGQKGPTYAKWNEKPIPADAAEHLEGAGLLHALSKTCALDVDNLSQARVWLAERDVDLNALLNDDYAVRISSGTTNRAKLLYKLSRPMRTLRPKGSGIELRCATADGKSVHDALPPSVHPSGRKYAWEYGLLGDWQSLPAIPAALLSVWRNLTDSECVAPTELKTIASTVVDIGKLRKAAFKHDPNCEHDEWLRVGLQLHDGTGGAQEGLDIWTEWSSKATRDQQGKPGVKVFQPEQMRIRYLSFGKSAGPVASGAALVAELPAEAEEFPLVNPVLEEAKADEAAQLSRAKCAEMLEKRLVFVRNAERYFDTEHHKLIGSNDAIEHLFTSMMPKRISPVKVLKASRTKRIVDSLAFHPGEGALFDSNGETFANNYRNRLPEPLQPTDAERQRIDWLFDRIDDPPYREWLLQFFGHVVQHPGVKIKSAPLIWSEKQGNGKSTLVKAIPELLVGHHYSKEVTVNLLNSDFNDYLLDAWHVNLTEFRAGARGEREAISKKIETWIADDTISMHPKGRQGYTMPNHMFLTASSNKDDAASIDNNDRKWAIHELNAPAFSPREINWIYHEFLLQPRAAAVLRHYFMNVSLTGFHPSAKAIETAARQEMVESSLSPDHELLQTAFEQCTEPLARDVVITHDVAEFVRRHSVSKPSAKRIGKILCKPPFNGKAIQFRVGKAVYRGIVLRGPWLKASGTEIMAHISGNDIDITV